MLDKTDKELALDGKTKRFIKEIKNREKNVDKKGFTKYFSYEPTTLVNNLLGQNTQPSRQILVPRTSRGRPPPTSPGRPLKILFDRPGDVPIWHPGDVLKWRPRDVLVWRSRDVPGRLMRDVPRTFSGRPLQDLQSTQTWMSQHFFKLFFQNLFDCKIS